MNKVMIADVLKNLESKFLRYVGHTTEAKGKFPFGNCIVTFDIDEKWSEIEVYNYVKGTFLDNIANYLKSIEREIEECDEWNYNGFRNELDYINYKL